VFVGFLYSLGIAAGEPLLILHHAFNPAPQRIHHRAMTRHLDLRVIVTPFRTGLADEAFGFTTRF